MPISKPFPRSADPAEPVVLIGALYDRIVAALEAASKINVAPPLNLTDGPAGKTLSIRAAASRIVLVKIISAETEKGRYSGRIIAGPVDPSYWSTADLDVEDYGTLPGVDDAEVWNPADIGSGNHSIDPSNPRQQFRHGIVLGQTNESPPRRIISLFDANPFPSGLKYQVWMIVDDASTMAWDYPRFP